MSTTTIPSVETVLHGQFIFHPVEVVRTERITPRMIRVSFGGPGVASMISMGPLDDIRIQFPVDFAATPLPPLVSFNPLKLDYPENAPPSEIRAYTIRRLDIAARLIEIDFAVHADGLASNWAEQAIAGRKVCLGGPLSSKVPRNVTRAFFAGDETGLPGLGRAIEEMPAGAHVTAIFEVNDASEEQSFETEATLDLLWVHRNGAEAGATTLLEEAVRAQTPPDAGTFIVVTGEAGSTRAIRRYFVQELGVNRDIAYFVGYWKQVVNDVADLGDMDHAHHDRKVEERHEHDEHAK